MKKLTLILSALTLILTLTSCLPDEYKNIADQPDPNRPAPLSVEELYSIYNEIDRGMTKSEIDEKFGKGNPKKDDYGEIKYYEYFNETESAGATVVYDSDNIIVSKTLFFNTKKNLIPFSGRFINDNISLIKDNMTVQSAIEVMDGAEPLEIACTYGDDGPLDVKIQYHWFNEDGSSLLMITESGSVIDVAFHN